MATGVRITDTGVNGSLAYASDKIEVEIKYDSGSVLQTRNKVGIIIESNGIEIAQLEVDADSLTDAYVIDIANIIKRKIDASKPSAYAIGNMFSGKTVGYYRDFVLKPYSKQIDSDGTLTENYDPADDETITAIRGLNFDYYLENKDMSYPIKYDNYGHNITGGGSGSITILEGGMKVMYYPIRNGGSVEITLQHYKLDANGNHVAYGSPVVSTYNTASVPTPTINKYELIYQTLGSTSDDRDISKTVVTFSDPLISQKTYVLTALFPCAPNYDFRFNLLYFNYDGTWRSLPFSMKNDVTYNREVFTYEGYDFSKHDYDVRVTKRSKAKSDFVTNSELIYSTLFGLGSEFYSLDPNNAGKLAEVRLSDMSVPHKSGKNMTMERIEVNIEYSNKILTP